MFCAVVHGGGKTEISLNYMYQASRERCPASDTFFPGSKNLLEETLCSNRGVYESVFFSILPPHGNRKWIRTG